MAAKRACGARRAGRRSAPVRLLVARAGLRCRDEGHHQRCRVPARDLRARAGVPARLDRHVRRRDRRSRRRSRRVRPRGRRLRELAVVPDWVATGSNLKSLSTAAGNGARLPPARARARGRDGKARSAWRPQLRAYPVAAIAGALPGAALVFLALVSGGPALLRIAAAVAGLVLLALGVAAAVLVALAVRTRRADAERLRALHRHAGGRLRDCPDAVARRSRRRPGRNGQRRAAYLREPRAASSSPW